MYIKYSDEIHIESGPDSIPFHALLEKPDTKSI